ncbi:MAG: hypothetical protein OEY94_05210 [Alphaproteobacteria bacterium]|nr:hypothetical protein [Alphaproteobacteria bacterium]
MRSSKFLLLAFLSLFTLSACDTITPKPMGRGYSSYDKPYKSADGSESRSVGYDYTEEKNIAVMDDIQITAKSLVQGLGKELSYSAETLYLDMPNKNSAFLAAFDHALRSELNSQGYSLSMDKEKALPIVFIAQKPDTDIIKTLPEGYETLFLALGMNFVKDKPQTVIGGFYDVPVYDFAPSGPDVEQLTYSTSNQKSKPCAKNKTCAKCGKKDGNKPCTLCEQSEKEFQKATHAQKCISCMKDKPCSKCANKQSGNTNVPKICNRLCSKDCNNSCEGKCDTSCKKQP